LQINIIEYATAKTKKSMDFSYKKRIDKCLQAKKNGKRKREREDDKKSVRLKKERDRASEREKATKREGERKREGVKTRKWEIQGETDI